MPSLQKQRGRPFWFAAFRIWDPETHRWQRVMRSTKTRDKREAREICRAWHKASLKARNGSLNEESARAIIAAGVSDVLLAAQAEALPSTTIQSWCETWLRAKAIETGEATRNRYKPILDYFTEFLGVAKCNRDLGSLHESDIAQFRDREARLRSRSTANLSLKVLRSCLREAVRQRLLQRNPAGDVKLLKSAKESKRRPFTVSEIKRILEVCNQEWSGLVLFGLYLGQRLGDLARLTWRAVNLEQNEVAFTARKTGRRIVLPLMRPVVEYLSTLPASDNPDAFIFPGAAKHKRTASLSNQFREVLVEAGLVPPLPRGHRSTGKGRTGTREASEISFHSLRHSAVTMLKASGLSDVIAREIVGHESAAVSRQYTHLTTEDLRNAMNRLPDVRPGHE
jgi:integrase